MAGSNDNGGQAISKIFSILEFMAKARNPLRLVDLATHLKIPQATLQRYMNSLIALGYVYQDEDTLRYALTWKLCRLDQKLSSPLSAKTIVGTYVNKLAQTLNLGVAAMIMQGYDGIYIDLIDDPETILASLMRIGNCPPLNSTASGKVLLSQFNSYEIDDYIAVKGLERKTDKTIVTKEALLEELERVRQRGYGTEVEECSEHVECVAVPVYDFNDSVYMALSVFDKSHITESEELESVILPKLCEYAREISRRMGCSEKMLDSYKF